MTGRHRAAPHRALGLDLGKVGALVLLTAAPLVHVSTATADSTPSLERRAQADDDDRDDADERDSSDADDRRSGARKASNRERDDDADDRGYRGRHRMDSDDEDDEPRGPRTRTAYESDDDDDDDDDRSSRMPNTRAAGSDNDRASRKSRTRATEASDDDRSSRRSRSRTVEVSEDSGTTRKAGTRAASVSGGAPEAKWDRLAKCESNQRWSANTGNGYRGGLQFSDSTWQAYGGDRYAPNAHQASRSEQIAVAEKVRREQGWNAWPACSRKLGYT